MTEEHARIEEAYENFMAMMRERVAGITVLSVADIAAMDNHQYTSAQKEASQELHNSVDTVLLEKLVTTINEYNDAARTEGRTNYALNNVATLAALAYSCVILISDNGDGNEATIDQTSAAVGDYIHMLCMADFAKRRGMN